MIVGGNRTPFAKAGGAYASASNSDLLTAAIDGLVARFGLAGRRLDEVAAGAVLKHSRDFNLTREAVLGSALAPTTPAVDLQQACGTGLEAVIYIANKIALGQAEVGVGGGVDSASDAPITVSEDPAAGAAEGEPRADPAAAAAGLRHVRPGPPRPRWRRRVVEPRTGVVDG